MKLIVVIDWIVAKDVRKQYGTVTVTTDSETERL
jgi:hypothetical protein